MKPQLYEKLISVTTTMQLIVLDGLVTDIVDFFIGWWNSKYSGLVKHQAYRTTFVALQKCLTGSS